MEESRKGSNASAAQILMIPYPAQPHIIPMLDLAHQLTRAGNMTVTFVSHQALIDRLMKTGVITGSLSAAIHLVGVPDSLPGFDPPEFIPRDPAVLMESLQLEHSMKPFVEKLVQDGRNSDAPRHTCMVVDYIHWWTIEYASQLQIPRYTLSCNPAGMLLALLSCPPNGCEVEEGTGLMYVSPAFPPLSYINCPSFMRKDNRFSGEPLKWWQQSLRGSETVLVNTCTELESEVISAFRVLLPNIPVLPVGPLGQSPALFAKNVSMEGLQLSDEASVAKWLGHQPPLSVLYISFGTTGLFNLAKRHVHELARGLEASQQRFMWALRAPPDVLDDSELLPIGFEERVKDRGLLLRGWAPQLKILAHPSTGGFLSSCGWNSTIESVARAVPIIGWPSFADQGVICRYMVKLNVAIELPLQEDMFVEAAEIEKAVKMVLLSEEGKALRESAEKYKRAILASQSPGGSSTLHVQEFANYIRKSSSCPLNEGERIT